MFFRVVLIIWQLVVIFLNGGDTGQTTSAMERGRDRMIYDVHTHLWSGRFEENKRELLRAAEAYHIDKLFVSGLNSMPNPSEEQAAEVNQAVWQFKKEQPGLVEGYVYVSPEHPGALESIRRGIEDWGFVGVKLWMASLCDDPRVFPVVEQCIEYRAPILIHSFHKAVGQLPFETTGEHVANLARRYPQARILMAHLGGNAYHGLPAIRDCPNVWTDICSSIVRGDSLSYALELLGEDRILFGTDMPGSYLVNQGQVEELAVSDRVKEKIFYRNACKLFEEVLGK